jgi:hypothetical protein
MAVAGIECYPRHGITSSGAELFPSRALLRNYIWSRKDAFYGSGAKGCRRSTFSFTTYGVGDKPPEDHQGWLLCYVRDETQWFEWTASVPQVYAYASRADEAHNRLYHQWSYGLAQISSR